MTFKFEKLRVWQNAMTLAEQIDDLTKNFPKKERYNLSSQLRRSSDSIALNIGEGSIEQSGPEFKRFLNYAIRSVAEVVTCLHKAKNRKYIDRDKFKVLYERSFHLMNMLIGLKSSIKM